MVILFVSRWGAANHPLSILDYLSHHISSPSSYLLQSGKFDSHKYFLNLRICPQNARWLKCNNAERDKKEDQRNETKRDVCNRIIPGRAVNSISVDSQFIIRLRRPHPGYWHKRLSGRVNSSGRLLISIELL